MTSDHEWLARILARPAEIPIRQEYAGALERDGDATRAEIVRLTCRALALEKDAGLRDRLQELPEQWSGWARLVGARLISEMEQKGLSAYVPRWMPFALPGLALEVTPDPETPPIGSTFFWGDPDLPEGVDWPTYADCTRFFGPCSDIDPDSRCHFVGQVDLAQLARSPAAVGGPATGLLSIFAFEEYERLGIAEIAVMIFRDVSRLRRVPHPPLDEANQRRPCHRATLQHVLTLPENYDGPWAEAMAFVEGDGRRSHDASAFDHVLQESGGERFGLLGHLRATTGGDPTPDRDWQRLICVPSGPERVIWHHVAIRSDDLATGNLERWRSVWVDMDG